MVDLKRLSHFARQCVTIEALSQTIQEGSPRNSMEV